MVHASTKRTSPGKRRSLSSQSTCRNTETVRVSMRPWPLLRSTSTSTWPPVAGCEGGRDVGPRARPVAFDGEQIIGSGLAYGSSDLSIAGYGVDEMTTGAFEAAAGGELFEQHRDGGLGPSRPATLRGNNSHARPRLDSL
jgi:hypothetical protein